MLGKLFGASFKTTIFGWLATAVGGTAVGWTDPVTGKPNYLMIVGAIFAAIWARVQKDHDVSGVPQ